MSNQRVLYDKEFKFISTDKLADLNEAIIKHTIDRMEFYKGLFDVEELHKLTFIMFDNLEEFREDYRLRCHREPPEYSRGCFNFDVSRVVIDEVPSVFSDKFYKTRASNAHEAFHIFYRDLCYKTYERRIVWFDEGMATFFSGEMDHYTEEQLEKRYYKVKDEYKCIDNLNERVQGNSSVSDDKIFSRKGVISGYELSFFAIKYLYESEGLDYIKDIMRDNNKILDLGNTIISDMFSYYDKKYGCSDKKL